MLRFRRAPSPEDSAYLANYDPFFGPIGPTRPQPFVRRQFSRERGMALEMLGHAIEYLADEYANDLAGKGPLGNADPRVAAIQILKGLNRSVYYSGKELEPALSRVKRWLGSRVMGL
jgi:hypothetical protein